MGQEVVTTLTIDANTGGADRFTDAMAGAERAAQGGVNNITAMWAALGGASVVAAVVGVNSVLDQVAKVNKELADVNQNAKQYGMTLAGYQSYKFAANVGGLDDSKLNDGLQKSAALLNDAQRNANSLTKIFEANSVSIKNSNGQQITQNQLLDVAANLMEHARTEQDKFKIAEMLGFTKQWVPFLEQGADAISRTAKEAQAAGAVIDDATIAKADEFDKAWRKSSVEWAATLKGAALSVLPYIDDLVTAAGSIFTKENLKGFAKPGQDAITEVTGGIFQPDKNGLLPRIDFVPEVYRAIDDWNAGNKTFGEMLKSLPVQPFTITKVHPYAEQSAAAEYDNVNTEQLKKLFGRPKSAGMDTNIPANDMATTALDRAIEQIEKHTAKIEADTPAIGRGVGTLSKLRTNNLELAA